MLQAATFGVQDVSTVHMNEVKKEAVSHDGKGIQLAPAPNLAAPAALKHKEKMGFMGVKVASAPAPSLGANSTVTWDAVLEVGISECSCISDHLRSAYSE